MAAMRRRRNRGLTKLGLLVLVIVVGGAALVILEPILPSFFGPHPAPYRAMCICNLKQVGFAVRQYAYDHDDRFPSFASFSTDADELVGAGPGDATAVGSLGALVTLGYLGDEYEDGYARLVCPETKHPPAGSVVDYEKPDEKLPFSGDTLDYAYVAGLGESDDADSPLALDDVGAANRNIPGLACGEESNHGCWGVNVLYAGGYVMCDSPERGRGSAKGALPRMDGLLRPPPDAHWRVAWEQG